MAIRLFRHYWHVPLALLALIEFGLFTAVPLLLSDVLPQVMAAGFSASERATEWPGAVTFSLCMIVGMLAMGLHNARRRSRFLGLTGRVVLGAAGGLLAFVIIAKFFESLQIGHAVLAWSVAVAIVAGVGLRLVFDNMIDADRFKRRVLVYGAGRMAGSIATLRRRADRRGFAIVGYLRSPGDVQFDIPEGQVLSGDSLLELCRSRDVDEIVVAMDDRRRSFPMDQLLDCRLDGVEIIDVVSFLERETGRVRLDVLNPSWMIFSEGFRRGRINSALERIFDIVASFGLLVVAAPFMLLAAIAIKLEDGLKASVFYGQVRVGQFGRPFRLLKFRSMREDAERDGKAQWAQKNDARVTKVGSFIRKTRIDELPQILNVLRGEMSFVGPRPERPEFVARLNEGIPFYRERHTVKPGITGWAQLCYPYGSSEQDALEKLQYDLFYVKNHTLLFYLAVLVQTVEVIVLRVGSR